VRSKLVAAEIFFFFFLRNRGGEGQLSPDSYIKQL